MTTRSSLQPELRWRTIGDSTSFARFHLDLEEDPGGEQRSTTSLPLPPTTPEDLRLDGYLEYPLPQRRYTFPNIHVFSGIRTQALRHRSQRH
ncbi:hypothetical protein TNCV_1691881 [Trichonephila clavipes]|nr:hypothetical protein TNCV_1691881 [Trichonephila clavipes]